MKIGDRDTPGSRIYAERDFREEAQILVATEAAGEGNGAGRSRTLSASARRRISLAQKARWAKVRAGNVVSIGSKRGKRTLSAAGRKRIAAAQRARWAKVRASACQVNLHYQAIPQASAVCSPGPGSNGALRQQHRTMTMSEKRNADGYSDALK
jgi:hypothetical protein